jgi:hypothetical protein
MKEQLVFACACGTTLKVSAGKGNEEVLRLAQIRWSEDHPDGWDHESVSVDQARRIRDEMRKRSA